DPAATNIYTLSLHDALPILLVSAANAYAYQERLDPAIDLYNAALQYSGPRDIDRPAVRESLFYAYLDRGRYEGALEQLNQIEKRSEEHTSELQSRENLVCRL